MTRFFAGSARPRLSGAAGAVAVLIVGLAAGALVAPIAATAAAPPSSAADVSFGDATHPGVADIACGPTESEAAGVAVVPGDAIGLGYALVGRSSSLQVCVSFTDPQGHRVKTVDLPGADARVAPSNRQFMVATQGGTPNPEVRVYRFGDVDPVGLDVSFDDAIGGSGSVLPTPNAWLADVAIDSQRRTYVLALTGATYPPTDLGLYRFDTGGAIDTAFGTNGRLAVAGTNVLGRLNIRADDRVTVTYPSIAGPWKTTQLDATGAVNPTFAAGSGGVLSLPFDPSTPVATALDRAGNLLVGGVVTGAATVARYDATGTAVPFGASTTLTTAPFAGIEQISPAIAPTGGFYVLARVDGGTNPSTWEVARYDATGSLDPTFDPTGPHPGRSALDALDGTHRRGFAVATDASGQPVVAGISSVARTAFLARLRRVGTPTDVPLLPTRLLDTRLDGPQVGYVGAKPTAGQTIELTVPGVPVDAAAVHLTVTGTDAIADGFVTVWPCGTGRPNTSNLNLVKGGTTPASVTVATGTGGSVCLYTQSGAHLVADLEGYVPRGSAYAGLEPARVLDTRPSPEGVPTGYTGPRPAAGQTIELAVTVPAIANVPPTARAVTLNVTATNTGDDGFVTVWPCGTPRPLASNLNARKAATVSNLVVSKIGTDGKVCLYTQSTSDLIADLSGYYAAGATYIEASRARALDTRAAPERIGYGGERPAAGATVTVSLDGIVPADAEAVVLNVTGVSPTANGYVTVWPCGAPRPLASNLNLVADITAANLVRTRLGATFDGSRYLATVCVYTQSGGDLVVDAFGYSGGTPPLGVTPPPS